MPKRRVADIVDESERFDKLDALLADIQAAPVPSTPAATAAAPHKKRPRRTSRG